VHKALLGSLFVTFLISLTACDDPKEIGSDVFAQDIAVLQTDTLSVDASTVLIDSIATNFTSNLLVGRYVDPQLGAIEAASYFHIAGDTLKSVVDTAGRSNIKWITYPSKSDSIRLILPYNFYMGDTLQRQTFKLYQFQDTQSLDATLSYYNNSTAPTLKSTVIGQVTNARIRPIKNNTIVSGTTGKFDTLRIPITDPTLVNFLISQRDGVKNDALVGTGFKDKFRGFALLSESAKNTAVLGFSSVGAVLKVYYHYKYTYTVRNSANTTDSTVLVDAVKANDLYVVSRSSTFTNTHFHRITATRNGAWANLIKPTDLLAASANNNEVAMQLGTGLTTKVKFPTLANLKINKDVAINKAELVFEPNANPAHVSLPERIILLESTPTNRMLRATTTGDGSLIGVYAYGDATTAVYDKKNNVYTFNITSSLQNLLSGRNKSNGWIVSPNYFTTNSSGSTVAVSSKNISSNEINSAIFNRKNIKLKVYYTSVGR
jgi:hypothetical protein